MFVTVHGCVGVFDHCSNQTESSIIMKFETHVHSRLILAIASEFLKPFKMVAVSKFERIFKKPTTPNKN